MVKRVTTDKPMKREVPKNDKKMGAVKPSLKMKGKC